MCFSHLSELDTMRSMPWVLLLTDIVMCSPSWKRVVLAQLGLSLVAGSALTWGSADYFFYTMIAQAACVAWRLWGAPCGTVTGSDGSCSLP